MVLFRAIAVMVTATAWLAMPVTATQAVSASCPESTLQFKPARVARGGVLTITGKNLGDDCIDTGTLPPGVGPLGNPLNGLAVVINQGTLEFVVATGSADSDYAFQVEVVVPAGLEPGEAAISLLAGDGRLAATTPLVISAVPPRSSAEAPVATFGPPGTDPEPLGSSPPVILPADIPDEPVATAPPLSAPPIENETGTGDLQRAIAVGVAGAVLVGAAVFAVWGRLRRR
jgi:hypothetical protein